MLQETTLYTAICDRCEKKLCEPTKMDDVEFDLAFLCWHDTGQLHFCPDCYTIDENDEIKLKPQINDEERN